MGIYSKMASRSLLRLTTSQRSPIISLVQRQLSTSPKVFSPWRKGIWGYIFIIPFREGKDTNHGYQYRIPVNLPEKKLANIAEVMMALLWCGFSSIVLLNLHIFSANIHGKTLKTTQTKNLESPKSKEKRVDQHIFLQMYLVSNKKVVLN